MSSPASSVVSPQASATPDLATNAGIAMLAKALYLATRLVLPPLVLTHLTLAEYGLWTAAFVLIMYVGLTDAGFSTVYVRLGARFHAAGDTAAINRLLSTGVLLLAGLSLLVFAGLALLLPLVLDFLKVATVHREQARILVLGAAAMFLLDLTLGAYCYLLHALQRIREEQQVAMLGYLGELLLIVVFLHAGWGVYALLAAFVLRYTGSLLAFRRLARRFLPALALGPQHFDRAMLRHFFGYGLTVQLSALAGTLLFSLDRVLAGFFLGPQGIALFELAAKLPVSLLAVPSAISNVTLAGVAHHDAREHREKIRALYLQATRAVALISAPPLAFIGVFAAPLSHAWLGQHPELTALPWLMQLSALAALLHICTGPGSATLRATGLAHNEFVYHGLRLLAVALALVASFALTASATSALAAGLCLGGCTAAMLYLCYNQQQLGLPLAPLGRNILLPAAGALLPALALHELWAAAQGFWPFLSVDRGSAIAQLLILVTAHSGLCLLLSWHCLLDDSERQALRQRGQRLRQALRPLRLFGSRP